jgi:hypothetical protein
MAIKRIYVHERVYDLVCDALAEEARNQSRERPRA